MTAAPQDRPAVQFWFDPLCPYSWIGSRWLLEVQARRPLDIDWRVMSLHLLNVDKREGNERYVDYLAAMQGPARVAAAVRTLHGSAVLNDLYTAYGARVFDHWRYAGPTETRAAMRVAVAELGLDPGLAEAFDSTDHDDDVRASHAAAMALVGDQCGTPVVTIDGAACYGPVLNSIPRGADAVRIFDGARLLAGWHDFAELKRTRVTVPVFA